MFYVKHPYSVVLIENFGINSEGGGELFDISGGPPVVLRKKSRKKLILEIGDFEVLEKYELKCPK